MTSDINFKIELEQDVNKIINSSHAKRVVVAGPGTGKSFLFQQAIKKRMSDGQSNFLALTFIGKLGDALADDLAGLAETRTLHGFARYIVLNTLGKKWTYYPKLKSLIEEDLKLKGINIFEIGDDNYKQRTKYYKAVGEDDVVHYAIEILKNDPNKIPVYDLVLVDEFQDFNEEEAELIDLLSTKNNVLIVGDDDQALYEFKGSFSKFIRDKYNEGGEEYESHTLRFCSRCTDVIVNTFHDVVEHYSTRGKLVERIQKDYISYFPDKESDNLANPHIYLIENVPSGMFAWKIAYELYSLLETQKIKTVLVIGEGRTLKKQLSKTGRQLFEKGFSNITYPGKGDGVFSCHDNVVAAYKCLFKDNNSPLGYRLLLSESQSDLIIGNYDEASDFIESLPVDFKEEHFANAKTLDKILNKPPSTRNAIAESSIQKLKAAIVNSQQDEKELLFQQLIAEDKTMSRPLSNLDITVCNILGSKGLGADVVFLIGFDQGKFPMNTDPDESEIYQMLVALTRAKKRIYLINSVGSRTSTFIDAIDSSRYVIHRN